MSVRAVKARFADPGSRRTVLAVASGALIVGGFVTGGPVGLPGVQGALFTLAAVIAGGDIALRALRSLGNRHISIDLLVTIAAAGALVIGETWEAAAVTFLFVFGAYLEARALRRTRAALQDLLELAPDVAVVLREGRQVEVAPREVAHGETVLVKPGSKLPVDGDVTDGRSRVDESSITGEPTPAAKEAGDSVFAGTVNGDGLLRVQATGVGADTTLARIVRRVEEAQEDKAPTQRFIERFARLYTPAVIVLAVGAWLLTADVRLALTLLVIGCPGALVISTPVSIVAGIGRAAKRGILVKGGDHLETAGKITTLAVDKTGTLTQGTPRLTDVVLVSAAAVPIPAPASAHAPGAVGAHGGGPAAGATAAAAVFPAAPQDREEAMLTWAAIAEAGSEHPLARAVRDAVSHRSDVPQPDAFESSTGRGVRALYAGHDVAVGNESLMEALGIPLAPPVLAHLGELREGARTPALVALDGSVIGVLGIADPLRSDAADVVRELRRRLRVVMLTGDGAATAEAVARLVGIDEVHAGLLPEDKLERIRALQAEGEVVAMLGDGINDAPGLAAADVGVAMGAAGTQIAIETADMALMADDLRKIPEAIGLSKATLRNIHQNVVIALLTVGGLLAGVLLGEVHMAGGMLVHEASVLIVILNAMRLMRA